MKRNYEQPKLTVEIVANSDILYVSSDPFVNDIPWEGAL